MKKLCICYTTCVNGILMLFCNIFVLTNSDINILSRRYIEYLINYPF